MRCLVLIFFVVIFACSKSEDKITIEESKLKEILVDLHYAEVSASSYAKSKQDSIKELYLSQICTLHSIDETTLNSNLKALYKDQEYYERLYDEIVKTLDEKEKTFYKEKYEQEDPEEAEKLKESQKIEKE
ncbi:MAG: DUF4296 domain-containing protein [Bacteroidota bacterium]